MIAAAFAAIALFVVAWTLLHVGFYKHKQVIDTPVYQRYGNAIADGKVPYRDFAVEYPPGALPMFALPGLAEPGSNQQVSAGFRRAFETLMWMCGAVALTAMAVVLRVLRRSDLNVWGALCFAAVAPLLLGSVILSRFDLWPAAICAAALAALVSNRLRLGHALLGLGITAKLFPVVFVPLGVAYVWKREGRREALTCFALLAGVVGAVFLPFVVLSPGGVWHSLSVQLNRPLQVESLGASLLLVGHHVFGFGLAGETSHGSQNVAGSAAGVLAVATTLVQVGVLGWIWTSFARGRGDGEALVRSTAAALCAFVALGKVLSPQFLIWLIPIVPLVRGRRGLWASALLAAALVLTQVWFPFRYFRLALHFEAGLSWVLLARDLALVAITMLLAFTLRRRAAIHPESP
ncbi:MAG TPA: glycosyltransferase 87 family protein [Gaiellaceae bacterium]|nr:glycosyltransferase 87 family protein [Gaiellaceae bacterium]